MRLPSIISCAALIAATPALADAFTPPAPIEAVTLYQDGATLTRRIEVELPAGSHQLIVRGLSPDADPSSLRLTGTGGAAIAIGAIDVRAVPQEVKPDSELAGRIKELRMRKETLAAQMDALSAKRAMMVRYAETPPMSAEAAKPLEPAQWPEAWELVGKGLAGVLEDLRLKRAEVAEVDAELNRLSAALAPKPGRAPQREAVVALSLAQPARAAFSLSYRVGNARWQPGYDARLATGGANGKPGLELVRRAEITQNTGEDWTNVVLTVSTAPANRGTAAPDLYTQRLDFYMPPRPVPYARSLGGAPKASAAVPEAADSERMKTLAAPAPEPAVAAVEQQAQMAASAYMASFIAPERVTVSGDGTLKTIRLGTRTLEPALLARTTPVLDETAYLEAKFVNDEEAPLLAGAVSVFRDGDYVGPGQMAFTAPGDSVTLGFGPDERIKVTRVPVKRKENEPSWFGQTKAETREFKTSVKNLHPFAVKVQVVDQVPISENSAISIETLPATTPPTEPQVNDRRGVMGWTFDLKPNEGKDLRLAYRMKWPGDRAVTFDPVR